MLGDMEKSGVLSPGLDRVPPQDEAAAGQDPAAGNEDTSVETIAEGQHEVDLLDLSISAEDIAAMRRVDARIEEARRAKRQALQEETAEPQIITRAKGKEIMLTEAERQEQYNKLQKEELRCKALQEKIRAQRLLLEKNAGTIATTTTTKGHGRNQPTKTCAIKGLNKDYINRRDFRPVGGGRVLSKGSPAKNTIIRRVGRNTMAPSLKPSSTASVRR